MKAEKIESNNLYSIERNRYYIFEQTVKELKHRVNISTKDPYNLVRISAILRLLFIDGSKFYNLINKKFKLKLGLNLVYTLKEYRGSHTIFEENDQISYIHIFEDKNGDYLTIDKFLNLKIIEINIPHIDDFLISHNLKNEYKIIELIKLFANAHGGVHVENWNKKIHGFISVHSGSPFNLNSNSDFHEILANISSLLLKMLEPLTSEVDKELKEIKPIAQESKFDIPNIGIISSVVGTDKNISKKFPRSDSKTSLPQK